MALNTVKVDLPAEIFGAAVNIPLIHQVVVAQQAAARQGTHKTKNRGEVSGSGVKPFKQKGTGRSRQGSVRAPEHRGGGVVHGPVPRSYDQRTPKKMKAAALRGALSDRATNGRVHVVDFAFDAPSTKAAKAGLASLTDRTKFLVVLGRDETNAWLSLRNLTDVHVLSFDQLNTYDVLLSDDVVFSKTAYDAFVSGSKAPAAKPAAVETVEAPAAAVTEAAEVTEAPAADELPAGAALPLEDGSAPEGYTIKGNADSGKFHAPGGRWYDATVAEFWFKTAEDAAAAGFTEAGKRAAKPESTEEGDK
jgi:large subunit ribosomal protein L4